ncbi:hypothetical protein EXIGLDRAFT_729302 [Exidia glandulosa HHB12029]|uniref:Uncharacterized protein n=1 Tax=Exidia glandulosa HHB12029 TaxID=1314781 RepID=A0A165CNE7_EXIGL|nr:hypothetical protein EXIGLDRAFT_729302 [Exidia glandulosa HHB12029]
MCKSLDTLRLDISVDLPLSRLLSLICTNTALRRLELHFPKVSEVPDIASHPWADVTTLPDVPVQNTVVICEVVSGDLDGWDSADVDFRLRHEQILFRALATQHIRLLTITCSPRTLDVAESLLGDMSTLRHVELRSAEVKVEDDRGFIKLFHRADTLLTNVLVPSMDHVYTLRLSILEWTSFNWGVFGCLEELQLDGTVSQSHEMRRAVGCPSLRRVTFLLSRYGAHDWDIEDSSPEHDEDALVAIALALTVGRLDAWPRPLHQLTITGDCIARDFTFDTMHTSLVSQIQLTTRPAPSRFDGPIKTLREACA